MQYGNKCVAHLLLLSCFITELNKLIKKLDDRLPKSRVYKEVVESSLSSLPPPLDAPRWSISSHYQDSMADK